ncbi:MAG TPA: RidA family protein [Myxococcota bacterium]|nr:RidA family protein [Myxococcota bacterium]
MRVVSTDQAPAAIGPYSQAIVHGDLVYCSGQVAIVPSTGELLQTSDVQEEARQVLANLAAVLEAAGTDLQHCLKVTVFLKDMDDFGAVNAVYAEAFGAHKPARACVEVARLPKDVRVEIDAVATTTG